MLYDQTIESKTLDLLRELAALPELKRFALVGGTALALQLGHRRSIDLDFFTQSDFDVDRLLEALESKFEIKITGREAFSLNCRINEVKVDFLRYRYPLLTEFHLADGFAFWSIEDIAAAKISAITNRGAKKDFYDLVELLETMSLDSVLSLYDRKYPSADRFMAIKSLSWFEDAEEEPDPISLREITWSEVKERVLVALKEITR